MFPVNDCFALLKYLKETKIVTSFPYIKDTKPACWVDDDGKVKGLFKDTLEIATRNLNLTLKIQKTLPKNENKWFVRYKGSKTKVFLII